MKPRMTTGETPFVMAFSAEAVISVEIRSPTYRMRTFDEE